MYGLPYLRKLSNDLGIGENVNDGAALVRLIQEHAGNGNTINERTQLELDMTEIAEVEAKRKVTLNLEVSPAPLKAAAADVRLACLRKDEGGCLYRKSPGQDVITVIGPDHVHHNFTTKLLWPSKKQIKSRRVLDLEIIREAAKKTGNEMLI